MQYGVLGPVELVTAAGAEPVRGARQRALLAVLLAHRGAQVPRERLIAALWPEGPPPSADHTLHSHASRVRLLVGPDLRAVPGGYRLDPQALDADRFDRTLREALRAPAGAAAPLLDSALGLWRGPAFGPEADLPEVQAEAERLDAARRAAHEALARALLDTDPARAALAAECALDGDPYREGAWAVLVRARTAEGRAGDAVLAYLRAAAALDEIGLLPSGELRAARAGAIGSDDPGRQDVGATEQRSSNGRPARTPPRATASAPPRRTPPAAPVPRPRTSFVGRESEVAEVLAHLRHVPLLTLVGPGGIGKTRLALEVAARAAPAQAGFVDLGSVRDPAAVPSVVATALGAGPQTAPAQALTRAGARDLVLVLDNCEHLLDAVSECVGLLLAAPGPLRVLATSRSPLGFGGEHVLPLAPLGVDGPESAAAQLFRDRAAAAGGGDGRPPQDAVARIVRRLDGLPLAVELAAARTATLSAAEIADLLDVRLDHRGPGRRVPLRHRSLAGLVAWSRELLGPEARRALDGWPVFAGACPPAVAAAVFDVSVATADELAAASLLVRDDTRGRTRFRMLHTVRAVVGPPTPTVHARHAAVLLDTATTADRDLRGAHEPEARARLDDLLPDLRVAHAWAATHDPDLAVRLTRALHLAAVDGLRTDVLGWPVPGVEDAPAVLAALAARALLQGHRGTAARQARAALAAATDTTDRLHALEILADLALVEGRTQDSVHLGRELAAEATSADDPHYRTIGLTYPVLAAAHRDRPAAARSALAVLRAEVTRSTSPTARGWLAFATGETLAGTDPDRALVALREAREHADRGGNRYLAGVSRAATVAAVARGAAPAAALHELLDLAQTWVPAGDRTHLLTALRTAVPLLARLDRPEEAARLLGTVTAPGLPVSHGPEAATLTAVHRDLAGRLSAGRLAALERAGRGDGLDDAVARLDAADTARSGVPTGEPEQVELDRRDLQG